MARRRSDKGTLRWKGGTLYWCGTVPVGTDEEGKIVWGYRERSTGTADEREAWKRGSEIQAEFLEALARPVEERPSASMTLNEVILLYLKDGGKNREYLEKFVDLAGNTPIHKIDQAWVNRFAEVHFPGRTAATKNRAVYTPLCAAFNYLASVVKGYNPPRIRRPRGWLAPSNFKKPPEDWWDRAIPHCPPHLEAYIYFTRIHMRRVSEACSIKPEDIDPVTWSVLLWDNKEEQKIWFPLAQPVIDALAKYDWRKRKYVFWLSSKSKVRAAIKAACAKAGVPYHVAKDIGRHSGASFLLKQGMTTKEVAEAGRWASTRMVDRQYGHLERRDVDDKARALNEERFPSISRQSQKLRKKGA